MELDYAYILRELPFKFFYILMQHWVNLLGTTTTYTENELVSLLKSRDSKAFSYLYDNYSGSLYTIICQIVDDMEMANDVLAGGFHQYLEED